MGNAGGGFASGFASTLMQGLQLMEHTKNKQEELKIQRDIADANLKLHAAQTAQLEQKAATAMKLFQRLSPQQMTMTEGGGGGTGESATATQQPAPLGDQERLSYAALLDPASILAQHPYKPNEGLGLYSQAGGAQTIAAPQRPSLQDMLTQAKGATDQMNGGPAPAAAPGSPAETAEATPLAPSAPAGPAAAPSGPQGAPGAGPGPHVSYFPEIAIDKDGSYSVRIAGHVTNFQVSHQTMLGPDGLAHIYERVFNPATGQSFPAQEIGRGVPPESMQQAMSMVRGSAPWLSPENPAFWRTVAEINGLGGLPPEMKAQRLAFIEDKLRTIGPDGNPAPAGKGTATAGKGKQVGAASIGEAITMAKQQEVTQAGAKTAAEVQARTANEPLQGADKVKVQMLTSVARGSDRVLELFNPAFVGKGFGAYSKQLQAEMGKNEQAASEGKYTSGALAGNLREFFGNASPEEIEFRKTLLDVSDMLLRARSGAQINEAEYSRLKGILASLSDEPNTFIPAMRRFSREANAQIDDTLKIATTPATTLRKERGAAPKAPDLKIPKGFEVVR